jgi:hypothetical protein
VQWNQFFLRYKVYFVIENDRRARNMKTVTHPRFTKALSVIGLTCGMLAGAISPAPAQTDQDLIEVARSVLKTDRQAIVVATMQLTDKESENFWPLYHEYRFEMDKINDGILKLVQEYAKLYPSIPGNRAKEMLKDYTNFQQRQVQTRSIYLKKFSKVLPATKALRLAQVETRLDLLVQLQVAAAVPLVPAVDAK